MDPIASILRNSAVLLAAKVVSAAMGLALVAVLPRLLGDAGYGTLHLALSLVGMFGVAADVGLTQVLARAIARDRGVARAYLARAGALTLGAGFVFYAALAGLLAVAAYPAGTGVVVAILGVGMVLDAVAGLLGGLYQGHERMLVPALARVAGNAVTLGVLAPRLWAGMPTDAAGVAAVLVSSSLVRLGIQAWGLRRLPGLRESRPVALPWRGLAAAGLPFLLWQALGVFYFRVDVIMLGYLTPPATVGWYGAATRLVDGLMFVADVVALTSFPVLARLWIDSPSEFRRIARRTLELLVVVALPLVVTLVVLAPPIVETLFSARFHNTVPILRVHALTLGFLFVDYFLATLLMAIGRERAWLVLACVACVLNPALNWFAIPATQGWYGNGGIGAALATLTTELWVAVGALAMVPRGALGRASLRSALPLAAAAALMAAVTSATLALGVPWVLAGAAGGLAYLAIALRLGLVPAEILSRIRSLATWRTPREVVS
jgi:O-antigen/teichoic acid export membrane protein